MYVIIKSLNTSDKEKTGKVAEERHRHMDKGEDDGRFLLAKSSQRPAAMCVKS